MKHPQSHRIRVYDLGRSGFRDGTSLEMFFLLMSFHTVIHEYIQKVVIFHLT